MRGREGGGGGGGVGGGGGDLRLGDVELRGQQDPVSRGKRASGRVLK